MNTYVFYIQYDDGWLDKYATCSVNRITAYDMLTEYLNDCGIDPADITVLDVEVIHEEE
jgi:hypothetical protein